MRKKEEESYKCKYDCDSDMQQLAAFSENTHYTLYATTKSKARGALAPVRF